MGRVICPFQIFCIFTLYLYKSLSVSVIYLCKVLWDQKIKALGYLFLIAALTSYLQLFPNCPGGFLWASRKKKNLRQEMKLFKIIRRGIWMPLTFI